MFKLKLHLHGSEVKELQLDSGREYTFGRSPSCDIQLDDQPGISRNHFRVYEEHGQWNVQVISKFGNISHGGQKIQELALEPGMAFKLCDYDFYFVDSDEQEVPASTSSTLPVAAGQSEQTSPNLPASYSNQNAAPHREQVEAFEGNDEVTRIVASIPGAPFIRIVEPTGEEETLKLEGKKWIGGREAGCEILLNDRKASRRQFELTSSSQGYFIRDLGSSNGTLLNGMPLAPDELRPLRSGDVLTIGSVTLHFEVRDPNFEKKLLVLPAEVIAGQPAVVQSPYEMINFPVPSGPGGAVRLDSHGNPPAPASVPIWGSLGGDDPKKKKMRFYLILAAVLIPLFGYLSQEEEPKKPAAVQEPDAFAKLSPKNQQMVKELYTASKDLYIQGKLENAASQLAKLHEIIPEGYLNSKAMEDDCRDAAAQAELHRLHQAELKRQEENRRAIEANLRQCEPLANSTMDVEKIRACLSPTFNLDPSHPKLNDFISRVQIRLEQHNARLEQQRDYQQRVSKGRSLYLRAEALEKKGDIFEAIEGYKKHIDATYPDPDNLKQKSQKNLIGLTKSIEEKVETAIKAAEDAYAGQRYRDAIDQIKIVKELDAANEKAAELNAKFQREMNAKFKEMYEEAIISEGLGNVDQAKINWKKIIDSDHPDGEYYQKARKKLRTYGPF